MPTVLVTGVNGFVGRHLVRELRARNYRVVGIGHSGVDPEIKALLDIYQSCDLTNAEEVAKLKLDGTDIVISLAGLIKSRTSVGSDKAYNKANVDMLLLLGERLLDIGSKARVIAVSTGLVYETNQLMPLTETSKINEAGSPYVVSKLLMEDASRRLRKYGLDCIIARPFNHSGPGQTPGYLIPDIYNKLTEFKQTGKPVQVSPKMTKRDYTDVRDVAKAYIDLAQAEKLRYQTYNICSGSSRSASDIMQIMQTAMGLDDITQEVDESLIRPNDPANLYGSYERLRQETGWQPTIPFEQTIMDFVSSANKLL